MMFIAKKHELPKGPPDLSPPGVSHSAPQTEPLPPDLLDRISREEEAPPAPLTAFGTAQQTQVDPTVVCQFHLSKLAEEYLRAQASDRPRYVRGGRRRTSVVCGDRPWRAWVELRDRLGLRKVEALEGALLLTHSLVVVGKIPALPSDP